MGADGGTIPTRCELVKTRQKPEQKDKDSVRIYKWQYCNLTQQPLVRPIVACELGKLYNKEAIIEKLLENKSGAQENGDKLIPDASTEHIKSLKDVKELQLAENPAFDKKAKDGSSVGGAGFLDRKIAPYICPVAGLEMNGRFKFVFDWSTGKVYSDRALKVVNKDTTTQISEENLVIINPEEKSSDAETMFTKMEARRARTKAMKKAAKEGKRKHDKSLNSSEINAKSSALVDTKSQVNSASSPHSMAVNGSVESKKAKLASSSKPLSASEKREKLAKELQNSKHKKKTIQNDETKSEVFKALFSTHKSAQNKKEGHWITFDPRYN